MDTKYWEERPGNPIADWQYEVRNGDTRRGYHEWCDSRDEGAKRDAVTILVVDEPAVPTSDGASDRLVELGKQLQEEGAGGGEKLPGTFTPPFQQTHDQFGDGTDDEEDDDACRTCGKQYAQGGDGYDGECPDCADFSALEPAAWGLVVKKDTAMMIEIHEAAVDVGYARPIFRALNRADVVSQVAAVCRADWATRSWGYDTEGYDLPTPDIPAEDEAVMSVYFKNEETQLTLYEVEWTSYRLDIGAPFDTDIDLTVDTTEFKVRREEFGREEFGGAVSWGVLMDDGGFMIDALEGFIVALAAAGFPIHTREFKAALSDYCATLANNMD